jgi:hypothetical protein
VSSRKQTKKRAFHLDELYSLIQHDGLLTDVLSANMVRKEWKSVPKCSSIPPNNWFAPHEKRKMSPNKYKLILVTDGRTRKKLTRLLSELGSK